MTANRGRHLDYYCGIKTATYRPARCIAKHAGTGTFFVCAEPIRHRPNALGVFKLEPPEPYQPSFAFDSVHREEWGWTKDRWQNGFRAYAIKAIQRFASPITVDYGQGARYANERDALNILNNLST